MSIRNKINRSDNCARRTLNPNQTKIGYLSSTSKSFIDKISLSFHQYVQLNTSNLFEILLIKKQKPQGFWNINCSARNYSQFNDQDGKVGDFVLFRGLMGWNWFEKSWKLYWNRLLTGINGKNWQKMRKSHPTYR